MNGYGALLINPTELLGDINFEALAIKTGFYAAGSKELREKLVSVYQTTFFGFHLDKDQVPDLRLRHMTAFLRLPVLIKEEEINATLTHYEVPSTYKLLEANALCKYLLGPDTGIDIRKSSSPLTYRRNRSAEWRLLRKAMYPSCWYLCSPANIMYSAFLSVDFEVAAYRILLQHPNYLCGS
jgi:hypothetical protein